MSANNLVPIEQFNLPAISIDLSLGTTGLGLDLPPDGIYTAKITAVNVYNAPGKAPSIALTFSGIGNGDRYHYLNIPQLGPDGKPPTEDKAARAFKGSTKAITTLFLATGILNDGHLASGQTVAFTRDYFAALKDRTCPVHYFAPLPDATDPNKVDFDTEEITVLTAATLADLQADPGKIRRWKKPKAGNINNPAALGVAAGAPSAMTLPTFGAAPTGPTGPQAIGGATTLPTMPTMPTNPAVNGAAASPLAALSALGGGPPVIPQG